MSVKESLWKTNIPYRLWTYIFLYIGLILSMISVFLMPFGMTLLYIGASMIFLAALYISIMLYRAGFRRHSIIFLVLILILCGVTIAAMLLYKEYLIDIKNSSPFTEYLANL